MIEVDRIHPEPDARGSGQAANSITQDVPAFEFTCSEMYRCKIIFIVSDLADIGYGIVLHAGIPVRACIQKNSGKIVSGLHGGATAIRCGTTYKISRYLEIRGCGIVNINRRNAAGFSKKMIAVQGPGLIVCLERNATLVKLRDLTIADNIVPVLLVDRTLRIDGAEIGCEVPVG